MADRPTNLYTRTGDQGSTALLGRRRVPKDSRRVQTIGDLDELNCTLGVVRALCGDEQEGSALQEIQNRLFELGTELAQPAGARLVAAHTARLEQLIDRLSEALPPLKAFILPGGTPAAAHCHLARAVCRRVERNMFRLARTEHVSSASLTFMNRLSDLLFVLARTLNHHAGVTELQWKSAAEETDS